MRNDSREARCNGPRAAARDIRRPVRPHGPPGGRFLGLQPLEARCLLNGAVALGTLASGPAAMAIEAAPPNAAVAAAPERFFVMYGHYDGAGVTDAIRDIIPPFTVIEGTSTDAAFIGELRAQGKVYAAHVTNPQSESAAQLVARWRAPFDNTLGGALPGGYDAIAIDELHGADTNGTAHSNAVASALQQLRALYPNKGIYAATTWQYGADAAAHSDQLNALNTHADLVMVEVYQREGNYQPNLFTQYADNLRTTVPGILAKSIYGLYISQGGFVADDSTGVGFWGFLDDQMHRIRNDPDAAAMPGLMFWVYYRTQRDLTPDYVARLLDHYYVKGNTGFYGDGSYQQLISNPGFDGGTAGWALQPGPGGRVERFSYATVGFDDDHDDHAQASHGSHGLRTVRGSGSGAATFRAGGLDTAMVYTASAWVYAETAGRRATLTIDDPDGTSIASRTIDHVGTAPDWETRWNEWSRIILNFQPRSDGVDVVLTDASAAAGTTLYWDFIELEEAWPASEPPDPVDPVRLPYHEDFDDGAADGLDFALGAWQVNTALRLRATPLAAGDDTLALLNVIEALPEALTIRTIMRSRDDDEALQHNGFVVFDHQDAQNFKFAGPFFGAGLWRIGRVRGGQWLFDASAAGTFALETDYDVTVRIVDGTVTILADGTERLARTYVGNLRDGGLGLGTRNGDTVFDDVTVAALASLPYAEDFNDDRADHLVPTEGTWEINAALRLRAAPEAAGGETVALLNLAGVLPHALELRAIMRSKDGDPALQHNGLFIFDHQDAANFKFAGPFFGGGLWRIGHVRDGVWSFDADAAATFAVETDYAVTVRIVGAHVTILADGVEQAAHGYDDDPNDGGLGLGTRNADTVFDDLSVTEIPPAVTVAPLATNDARPPLSGTIAHPTAAVEVRVGGHVVPATNAGDGTWAVADDAIPQPLSEGRHDVDVRATTDSGMVSSDGTTDELFIDLTAPRVIGVLVSGTSWSPAFRDAVDARAGAQGGRGYWVPTGSAAQLAPLAWSGIDQVALLFSEPVDPSGAPALDVRGVDGAAWTVGDPTWSDGGAMALWTLGAPLGTDRIRIEMSDTLRDAVGNHLDGEWQDGISTASGDGVHHGVFRFALHLVPGDLDADGVTSVRDIGRLRAALAAGTYASSADVNGDGRLDRLDALALRRWIGRRLPPA